jgi:hypothetical protein
MNMPMLKLHGRKFVHLDGLRALGLALILGGCGGGVDSGGTGAQPQSFASGPITGFGSVIVNGVRFDDSKATVVDDEGTARSRDDLRLGMTTEIRGTGITLATDGSGTNVSAASNIVYASELLGPLQSVDVAGKRLAVLGQTVDINTSAGTTVFDDVSVPGGLAALAAGDLVEVYAQFDAASGHYLATRVERKGSVATYRLRGVVSILNATTKTFNIGTQTISYAGLATAPPTSLANGNFMRVRLQTAQVGGLWLVAGLSEGVEKPKEMDDVRLEGRISAFTSATQFSVNGVALDASRITPVAGLALGVGVEVEATVVGGVPVASKVEIKTSGGGTAQEFQVRGPIASVDVANLSFVLRGVTVVYAIGTTDFRDGTAANLAANVNVEARGALSADGTRLVATRITFK